MKHVIIGTAGHVDHGKTLLIRALTGIDTDRLEEEKKRGITIELGFAHLDFEDGTQAGIVDVPGHEKFIKNMLCGAGGIDLAMLVVAADEGFMPQTVEHLNILTLLGIKDGLVVITKKDLVDTDWLELMQEEIQEKVKGSFLDGKPILSVSAYTGEGIPELKMHLCQLVAQVSEKSMRTPFRLPIDRVFSVDGFGTVVTGTLIEGTMHEGDAVQLVPSSTDTRIRNLQVHGKTVQTAYAGQRVAVNLAGLKKTDVQRGDVVARPGSVRVSRMLDVKLSNLPDSQRMITNDMQVHLYHGSSVMLAKVVLLDRQVLNPGESCYAQLRMAEEIATKNADHFVIRFYSPLETIGGGIILDDAPIRHKSNLPAVIEALKIKESGSTGERIIQTVSEFGTSLPTTSQIADKLSADKESLLSELDDLVSLGCLVEPLTDRFVTTAVLDEVWSSCKTLLGNYHKQNPLHAGMKAAELRQKLFRSTEQTVADALLQQLCLEGKLCKVASCYALADFEIRFSKRQIAIRDKLLQYYRTANIEPASVDEVSEMFRPNERADFRQVMDSVLSSGDLVMLAPQICYHRDAYAHVCAVTQAHFHVCNTITLAQLRDALGTSRKYALAILEYYDRNHITKKEGDFRKLQGFPV